MARTPAADALVDKARRVDYTERLTTLTSHRPPVCDVARVPLQQSEIDLSGAPTVEISPVDKSAVTMTSSVQGDAVVTTSAYPPGSGKAQHIARTLEGGGARYVVVNKLTVGDREIKVRSVFNRVAHD